MENIAFDAHKRYTLARVEDKKGGLLTEARLDHTRGTIKQFLKQFTPGSTVAIETIGNWYWIIDEIEAGGMTPSLVHARKAKLMMGMINKTDRLDARGLNQLQRNGVLPEVWIPPADLRDKRDLGRTRMVFSRTRTKLKNRIHSVLAKYAFHDFGGVSDIFGKKNRKELERRIDNLPSETRFANRLLLEELDSIQSKIDAFEKRMLEVFKKTPEVELLISIPGIGFLLAVIILNEVGDIGRFPASGNLAAYSGTTPRVHASGGKARHGRLRPDTNRYLQWAFVEAANSVCLNRARKPWLRVNRLYDRIHQRKGHNKAIGAVARHLAESTYHVLSRKEPYKEPRPKTASSRKA